MDPGDAPIHACCDEFRSAYRVMFANPTDGETGWLLYGTDYETVSAGQPELRYWPIRYCPFCGAQLPRIAPSMRRSASPSRSSPEDARRTR